MALNLKNPKTPENAIHLPLCLALTFFLIIMSICSWVIVANSKEIKLEVGTYSNIVFVQSTVDTGLQASRLKTERAINGKIKKPKNQRRSRTTHLQTMEEKKPPHKKEDEVFILKIKKTTISKTYNSEKDSINSQISITAKIQTKKKEKKPKISRKDERLSASNSIRKNLFDNPFVPEADPALIQKTAFGPLPKMSNDGRSPYQVYAKPFNFSDKRPRIGIVVSGLGLSDAATESAIQGLPASITLAFAPSSNRLTEWIRLARAAGHEVLFNIPMEPLNYPTYNPGPQTLITAIGTEENIKRLLWNLSRGTGYVGVIDHHGSRFTASQKHMKPVLTELKNRGLLYIDSSSSKHSSALYLSRLLRLPAARSTLTLDDRASRTEIDKRFGELERRARSHGRAIGVASPYPVSLERIATWAQQLDARGYAIAPITALAQPQRRVDAD